MEITLAVISIILIISVFLSLVRNDYWIFKVLEYPRIQKLFFILAICGCWYFFWPPENNFYRIVVSLLFISALYLCYKIWPYTILAKKEMLRTTPKEDGNSFTIFSANVLQDNNQYDRLLKQIEDQDPDIIFLLETNTAWANAMKPLNEKYPNFIPCPLENTYGLLFYSRLKLENPQVKFLVKDELPSVDTLVILPSGEKFQLWGLHPEPPAPGESLYSTAKDKELMKVALKAKDCEHPCIVCGDLNDVAWSHTTELFRKTSRLLDPRRGRGFYNTFSAHHWLIRFPLDYIFCSPEFGLVQMKRMPKNGSDHFATFTHLTFNPSLKKAQDAPKAGHEELQEAKEMARQPVKE